MFCENNPSPGSQGDGDGGHARGPSGLGPPLDGQRGDAGRGHGKQDGEGVGEAEVLAEVLDGPGINLMN
jgi:hypothetical protein